MEYVLFRKTEGVSKSWLSQINLYLKNYLKYCNWNISKEKTLKYLNKIQDKYSISSYRKKVLQIRLFLRYYDINWLDKLKIIGEPDYTPKKITPKDIEVTLNYFNGNKYYNQIKALILLGSSSGLRASELYRLKLEDIDLKNRLIRIKKSKTGKTRVVFFNKAEKEGLKCYISDFTSNSRLNYLFGEFHIVKEFKQAPISVKDLRKAFSQEWDRRNGSFAVKERLLGHSLKRVDFQHYSFLDESDLKQVYDKVM